MSAAPATADAPADGPAPKKGKKKLFIIIGAVAALLLVGGGGAFFMMKKKADAEAAAAAADGDGSEDGDSADDAHPKKAEKAADKDEKKGPPTFVPLDPFIVNLADHEGERFAQVGISLQVDDPHVAEDVKAYMPAIRNAVLLILSHKSSADLLTAKGKERLAAEIRIEAARAMGVDVDEAEIADDDADAASAAASGSDEPPKHKKKKKKKKPEVDNPIVQVHYSNFIIQ